MIDITKKQIKKPFDLKEYFKCVFIAFLPAILVTEILREIGIIGLLPTVLPIYGGAELVKYIRSKRRNLKNE